MNNDVKIENKNFEIIKFEFQAALSGRQLRKRFITQRDALGQDTMGFQPERNVRYVRPERAT